jgi:hypothetical protein
MLKKLQDGFRLLFADRRHFILECIRVGLALWFFVLVFIPFYTVTNGDLFAHFSIIYFTNFLKFWIFTMWIGMTLGYVFFRLLNVIKPTKYLLILMASISTLYTLVTLLSFLSDVNDFSSIPDVRLFLNVGFYFNVIFIGLMFLLALKENIFLNLINKLFVKKQK